MWGTKETNERLLAEQPDHKQGFEMKESTAESDYEEFKSGKLAKREALYRDAAKAQYHDEGFVEIDKDARVCVGEDGCYVQAWVFVAHEEVE